MQPYSMLECNMEHFGKQIDGLKKFKHTPTIQPSHSTNRYLLIINMGLCTHKDLCIVYSTFIYNSQEWKQPNCSSTCKWLKNCGILLRKKIQK